MYYNDGINDFMVGVVAILIVLYLVILGLGLLSYILSSAGLHRLGNRRNIPNAWMAWFPYAASYLLGSIADEYDGRNGIKRKWRALLLTFDIVTTCTVIVSYIGLFVWVFSMSMYMDMMHGAPEEVFELIGGFLLFYVLIFIVGLIATVQMFCKAICIYKVFESTVPTRSVAYFILYLLVPMAGSICLFSCRNKGYSNEVVEPVYQQSQPVQTAVTPEMAAEVVTEVASKEGEESIFVDE